MALAYDSFVCTTFFAAPECQIFSLAAPSIFSITIIITIAQIWLLLALTLPVAYFISRLLRVGRRPAGWPPGPPTVPLFGNILQVCSHRKMMRAARIGWRIAN
jgi:hypothetical protein